MKTTPDYDLAPYLAIYITKGSHVRIHYEPQDGTNCEDSGLILYEKKDFLGEECKASAFYKALFGEDGSERDEDSLRATFTRLEFWIENQKVCEGNDEDKMAIVNEFIKYFKSLSEVHLFNRERGFQVQVHHPQLSRFRNRQEDRG